MLLNLLFLLLWGQQAASFQSNPFARRHTQSTSLSLPLFSTSSSSNELKSLSVCIVGAGPSGLLIAHRLAKAGAAVRLLESRPRRPSSGTTDSSARAYALGIGRRGRTSIKSVDMELWSSVKSQGFASERFDLHLPFGLKIRLRDAGDGEEPEEGRIVEPSILLYQNDLCKALLDALEDRHLSNPAVQTHFSERVQTVDLINNKLTTTGGETFSFDVILGCDGVNSIVRKAIDEQWPEFETSREPIPGHFKVVRLERMPRVLDESAVALLLPKAGSVTAFVEPTKNGSCCILFAGNNSSDPVLSSSNTTELVEEIALRWPKLQDADLSQAALQLAAAPDTSTASLVKCNTFSYANKAALLGDAAHATGGVSGQGVNSALVDAMKLADSIEENFDPIAKDKSLRKALLEYSIQQVPEAKALFDLSFSPKPTSFAKRFSIGVRTLRDSIFKGRFGIGQLPLQTKLTTSLVPFREVLKQRDGDYEEGFPNDQVWRKTLTTLDVTIDNGCS